MWLTFNYVHSGIFILDPYKMVDKFIKKIEEYLPGIQKFKGKEKIKDIRPSDRFKI